MQSVHRPGGRGRPRGRLALPLIIAGTALLTAAPGPDVAPYHDRGVLPLPPEAWADWLFDRRPAEALLVPPPAVAPPAA